MAADLAWLRGEVSRLRAAIRVNALIWRPSTTDAEIERVLYPEWMP
jgi:hypothetical protein